MSGLRVLGTALVAQSYVVELDGRDRMRFVSVYKAIEGHGTRILCRHIDTRPDSHLTTAIAIAASGARIAVFQTSSLWRICENVTRSRFVIRLRSEGHSERGVIRNAWRVPPS